MGFDLERIRLRYASLSDEELAKEHARGPEEFATEEVWQIVKELHRERLEAGRQELRVVDAAEWPPETPWALRQPRCSICGITSDAFFEKLEAAHRRGPFADKKLEQITCLVGVCPKCRLAFCNDHLIAGNPHDWYDDAKCPSDFTPLDANWDWEPSEDKPWRIGPRPNGAALGSDEA